MKSQLFNHTYKEWLKNKVMENGAATYSKDICKFHGESLLDLGDNNIISTCPQFDVIKVHDIDSHLREKPTNIIQYLHTYPYTNAIEWAVNFYNKVYVKPTNKIILVTAYESFYKRLKVAFKTRQMNIMDVAFVPMGIDTSIIPEPQTEKYGEKRVIWFGNIYKNKEGVFADIRKHFISQGWTFDYISKSQFNGQGETLSQADIWSIVNKYSYGVGVGRCAMEMQSMGLKVMIAGQRFGGIITSELHKDVQFYTNNNGRIITFDRDISSCIEYLPESLIVSPADIKNIPHSKLISKEL